MSSEVITGCIAQMTLAPFQQTVWTNKTASNHLVKNTCLMLVRGTVGRDWLGNWTWFLRRTNECWTNKTDFGIKTWAHSPIKRFFI